MPFRQPARCILRAGARRVAGNSKLHFVFPPTQVSVCLTFRFTTLQTSELDSVEPVKIRGLRLLRILINLSFQNSIYRKLFRGLTQQEQDAKFGTIANVILIVATFTLTSQGFESQFQKDVNAHLKRSNFLMNLKAALK